MRRKAASRKKHGLPARRAQGTMKLATRVMWSYAVLMGLLAAALAYQASAIISLQTINRELTENRFRATTASLRLRRQLDLVDEFYRKYFGLRSGDYLTKLNEARGVFEAGLTESIGNAGSERERQALEQIQEAWKRLTGQANGVMARIDNLDPDDFPLSLRADLDGLQASINRIYDESIPMIDELLARSRVTGERAQRFSLIAATGAFLVGGLISFLIMRSVSSRLTRLTQGTRAIAEGDFAYRLSSSADDEFHKVARDFNYMARRLNELDQMKKDFVAHVSHEIKSPLASMRETVELLLEETPGALTDRQRRLLELNLKCSRRLSSMIENLLDLSRMEAGAMEYDLKKQDLAPLIQTAVSEFELPAREKKIEINCRLPEPPLLATCDGDRIIQVVANLVGNAVKFSPHGSVIEVNAMRANSHSVKLPSQWLSRIPASGNRGDYWVVEVADEGPGVPDSSKASIFERFHQVKRGARMHGQGTGLGLAICRTIVVAHGGTIWVEDNPGTGSRFRFVIPCAEIGDGHRRGESSPI